MPASPQDLSQSPAYQTAWDSIVGMTRSGASWSGHERNCAFLNCDDGTFADISATSGLDFLDDGRALAVTDWDGDGAQDLWLRNRTGPRLRLMRNRAGGKKFLALDLEGTQSNRDAIGARATVRLQNEGRPITRSLRAGEGFLSQSTKRLHFGLGEKAIQSVTIRWPSGVEDVVENIPSNGGLFRIVEGEGEARALDSRKPPLLKSREVLPLKPTGIARSILPTSVPLPRCRFWKSSAENEGEILTPKEGGTLLILWSHQCETCRHDLPSLAEKVAIFQEAGLTVRTLSVDAATSGNQEDRLVAEKFLSEKKIPFSGGAITAQSLRRLEEFDRILFDFPPRPAVPTAYLLDDQLRAVAIYRGLLEVERIISDTVLFKASPDELRDQSIPLGGRWITESPVSAQIPKWLWQHTDPKFEEQTLAYLQMAAAEENLKEQLSSAYQRFAKNLARKRKFEEAIANFHLAIKAAPENAVAHNDLGAMLEFLGRNEEAEAAYREALRISPKLELARANLRRLRNSGSKKEN